MARMASFFRTMSVSAMLAIAGPAAAANSVSLNATIDGADSPSAEVLIFETKSGASAAYSIRACIPQSPVTGVKALLSAPLDFRANAAVASAVEPASKETARIEVRRAKTPEGLTFTGSIRLGAQDIRFKGEDLSFSEDSIDPDEDDSDPSPNAVGVDVDVAQMAGVLAALETETVEIVSTSVYPSCSELAKGRQRLVVRTDPARAAALMSRLAALPGVRKVRLVEKDVGRADAVRLPLTPEMAAGGALDEGKAIAAIRSVLAKTLGGASPTPVKNLRDGVYEVVVETPARVPGAPDLKARATLRVLLAPFTPEASRFYLAYVTSDGAQFAGGPAGLFSDDDSSSAGDGDSIGDVARAALAKQLRGARWSDDDDAWKP